MPARILARDSILLQRSRLASGCSSAMAGILLHAEVPLGPLRRDPDLLGLAPSLDRERVGPRRDVREPVEAASVRRGVLVLRPLERYLDVGRRCAVAAQHLSSQVRSLE